MKIILLLFAYSHLLRIGGQKDFYNWVSHAGGLVQLLKPFWYRLVIHIIQVVTEIGDQIIVKILIKVLLNEVGMRRARYSHTLLHN